MKKKALIIILLFSNRLYSQKLSDSVFLTVESFKDTILKDERDYKVVLKLTNNSNSSIPIWNTHATELYYKAVYLKKSRDTLTNKDWFKKADIDYISPPYKQKIEPGKFILINYSLLAHLNRAGSVKVKFVFDFSALNKEIKEVETNWISQYVSYTYNELFQDIR